MKCENCDYDMGENYENCGSSEDGVCPECGQSDTRIYQETLKEGDVLECKKSDSNIGEGWTVTEGKKYTVLCLLEKSFCVSTDNDLEIYVSYWQGDLNYKMAS